MILAAATVGWALQARLAKAPTDDTEVFCTQDVQACPDGSYVARVAPSCEFALCPSEEVSTTTEDEEPNILPYDSGVEGVVMLGPTCPVVRDPPDPLCADRPYATSILVYRTGAENPYTIGNSGTDGTFRFSLPPGSYTLTARVGTPHPSCSETSVAVVPDEYATTTLLCDTGIR